MKTKLLEVHILSSALVAGTQYNPSNYPHDGAFFSTLDGNLYIKSGAVVTSCYCPALPSSLKEDNVPTSVQSDTAKLTIDDLIRTLAVCQKPDLAAPMFGGEK